MKDEVRQFSCWPAGSWVESARPLPLPQPVDWRVPTLTDIAFRPEPFRSCDTPLNLPRRAGLRPERTPIAVAATVRSAREELCGAFFHRASSRVVYPSVIQPGFFPSSLLGFAAAAFGVEAALF